MSEKIYLNNIESIRKRYIELADYIENNEDDAGTLENVIADVREIDANLVLNAKKNSNAMQLSSVYSNGILLDEWIKLLNLEGYFEKKMFMFGLGDGSFARKLLSHVENRGTVVVVEPSLDIMKVALKHYDMTDLFQNKNFNLILMPILEKTKLSSIIPQYIKYKDIESTRVLCYPNYDVLFPQDYSEYEFSIRITASNISCNQNLYANCGKECNENTFKNISYLANSKSLIDLINRMPKGFPAIVVAGGPSLDKNVGFLKKAKGKALIVCTDTALRPVIRAGIIPDIAISSDAFKGEKYFSEDLSRDVPLVCHTHVGYRAMECHRGIKFFYNNLDMWISSFMSENHIPFLPLESGGSVANDALSLARVLGADRIILIGQDLAYTDDKTHSESTVEGELETKDFRHMVWDVDIFGNSIKSSRQFVLYRDWIEETIIKYGDRIKVIDATEGGILIKGSEIMTLEDAINRECTSEYDFNSIIANSIDLMDSNQKSFFAEYMCSLPQKYVEISENIEAAMGIYNEIKNMVQKNDINVPLLKKLSEKAQVFLNKISSAKGMEYALNMVQEDINEILQKVNTVQEDAYEDFLAICEYGINTLVTMKKGIEQIKLQLVEMESAMKDNLKLFG